MTDSNRSTDRMIPESLVREFIGYLSGAVPELHRVEVPLLAKHWDDFKWTVGDRLSGEPAPATTDRVAPSFDAWWNDDAYGCLRYSDPVQFDRLRQAFNAGVAAARAAPEPAGGHGNPCPLCKAHNLASCECPQEDHVDSVKVQPAFYRIQHKFDKGRFNDFSTDMWDLIIPGLPLTKVGKHDAER